MIDKQHKVLRLADELMDGMSDEHWNQLSADAAALLRTLHEAIERKDALLRQALDTLNYHTEQTRPIQMTIDAKLAIEKELNL